MNFRCINTVGLLGYIIIVNEEIHSRQVKLLKDVLKQFEISDDDKDGNNVIKDIIDNKDETLTYHECLEAFRQEDKKNKEFIYEICLQLAIIDDENIIDNKKYVFAKPDKDEERILRNLESYMEGSNISLLRRQSVKTIRKEVFTNTKSVLYSIQINSSSLLKVASEDYETYKLVFNTIFDECKKLQIRLETKLSNVQETSLKDALNIFLDDYKNNVLSALDELKAGSIKKESASQCLSIALMGRTKAGKSTLHYIMCDEGEEFIGKGSQRTTRFNRVFNWNQIKIIDTPGIGAGEEEGKKDEAIAFRVISQADMICFVLVDDTIQEDILEFLNKIAEYHKPMLIILNHKEDIRKKSHKNTFLENPDKWKEESDLEGYIDRLTRNAERHNYDKLMKVVPVFLLAAQIGKEKNDEFYYDHSNIPAFFDAMGSLINANSEIYKSQTMLDEPSIRLHKMFNSLDIEKKKLYDLRNRIEKIKKRINDSIVSSRKNILEQSERSIKEIYEDFKAVKSYEYMNKNYKEKNLVELNNSYNQCFKDYKIEEKIGEILESDIVLYRNRIEKIVQEMNLELHYAKLNTENLFGGGAASIMKNTSTFPFKEVVRFTSTVLEIIANYYPILFVISIPLSIFGDFMKSKEEKINDAKKHTLDNFNRLADYSKDQVIKKTKEEIKKLFKSDEEKINADFKVLEEQLDDIKSFVSDCCDEFKHGIEKIDEKYAERVLKYVTNKDFDYIVKKTERDIEKNSFAIYVSCHDIRDRDKIDISKYRDISTEKIKIYYVN